MKNLLPKINLPKKNTQNQFHIDSNKNNPSPQTRKLFSIDLLKQNHFKKI